MRATLSNSAITALFSGAGRQWLPLLMLSLICTAQAGELAIIMHPDSGMEQLSKAEVINIFMGRQKRLPSGATALTVDLAGTNGERQEFYSRLVNKDLAEINSYWARLIFSGQSSPPRQVETAEDVLDIIANNKGAIGYIDKNRVSRGVRIVHTLPRIE